MQYKSALTAQTMAPEYNEGDGADTAPCHIWGCPEMATTTCKNIESVNFGDPRCDTHAL